MMNSEKNPQPNLTGDNHLNSDYENFFNMLKFWITQTNNNIEREDNRVKLQEISNDKKDEAAEKFTNPQFFPEYLDYTNFSIRISFFKTGHYKSEKANYLIFNPDEWNKSWWINIRYNYDKQVIIASYRSDLKENRDSKKFKNYMEDLGFGEGLRFKVSELELGSDTPNLQVKKLFDYFYEMIEKGREFKEEDSNMRIQELSETLKQNYNVILRGAPGTGKTFLAQQIAANIISNGKTDDMEELSSEQIKRIGFVQFHPSYDYTDFVEGMRPISIGNQLGFDLKPGIFKTFCGKASESTKNKVDNFEETWEKFRNKMEEEQKIKVAPNQVYAPSQSWETSGGIVRSNDTYNLYITKDQLYKVYRGDHGVPKGGNDNYRKKVIHYMKENLGLLDYKSGEGINDEPYVFIIDEINRGEISKIFGELFFSLDPGYRGPKGGVLTQYSNLHEKNDDKHPDEKFYIPKNVYILGTMNDIDRSVDTFDFAMRRRFTFIEITAEESSNNMLTSADTKALMARLNEALVDKNKGGLTRDYEIGASYFLPIDGQGISNEIIEPLWNNKLLPLFIDYFRGEHEAEEKIEELKKAYFGMKEEN